MVEVKSRKDFVKVAIGGRCALFIPRHVWGRAHTFEKSRAECAWNLGDAHEGTIWDTPMFNAKLQTPICTNHLSGHRVIMSLRQAGHDINDIVDMSPREREELSLNIILVPWSEI